MDIMLNFALAAGLGLLGFGAAVPNRGRTGSGAARLPFAAAYVLARCPDWSLWRCRRPRRQPLHGFQKTMWIVLGTLYVGAGAADILGYGNRLGVTLAGIPDHVAERRRAVVMGALFSLNIPACAAPLLALVIGSAAVAQSLATGFLLLAVFGLAISLPVAAGLVIPVLQRPILSLSRWSDRVPVVSGVLLAAVGPWSILLALRTAAP